jgi:hypothetical protein
MTTENKPLDWLFKIAQEAKHQLSGPDRDAAKLGDWQRERILATAVVDLIARLRIIKNEAGGGIEVPA